MKPTLRSFAVALAIAVPYLASAATPIDPKSPLPGYPDGKGPTGPVSITIKTPKQDEVFPIPPAEPGKPAPKGARVVLEVEVKNFETWKDPKSGQGQHLQMVLDGRYQFPYRQVDKPWVFPALPKGTHTIRLFAQRPWHESIKEKDAFAAVTFHVGEKDPTKPLFDPSQPTITANVPRGKIKKSEAAKILFDFFVTGCTVGPITDPEACQVVYRLDAEPQKTLTAWEPVWWENVPVGRHAYVIALYRGEKRIEAPYALDQESFEVVDDGPAAPAGPAGETNGTTPAPPPTPSANNK